MDEDYSIYVYYKGSDLYPNIKSLFFGEIEMEFDINYEGKPEDKKEAFKVYMAEVVDKQVTDYCSFHAPRLDIDESTKKYWEEYLNPELHVDKFEWSLSLIHLILA